MGIPCLSRPKEPSLSSLAGSLLLLGLWCSPHSPALPSLASPTSTAGREVSVCCPGIAAKSRGDHESAPTRPCYKLCSKNDWVLSQQQWAQSQKIAQQHSFPKLSSFYTFSLNVIVAGAHQHRFRDHLCQWCRPTQEEHGKASVLLAPVGSKHHRTLWTANVRARCGKGRKIMSVSRKLCWTTNNTKERKHYVLVKETILTRHNGVKNLRPLLSTNGRHRLTSWWPVALMGVIAGSAEKWSKTKQRNWGTAMEHHYESLHFEWIIPSSKACSSNVRLWSRPEKSIDADALRARGTKRQEILALLNLLCILVSASVETSPSPDSTPGTSIGPEKEQRWNWPTSPLLPNVEQFIFDS